jgi:hypothetical protein
MRANQSILATQLTNDWKSIVLTQTGNENKSPNRNLPLYISDTLHPG